MTTTNTQTELAPVGPPARYRIAMQGQYPGHKPTRLVLGWAVPQEPTGFLVRAIRQVLVITVAGEQIRRAPGSVSLADRA
jgi:hypothetical protein